MVLAQKKNLACVYCCVYICYRLRHQRIDGGTGMVLAQKKFPTCVYIVHTLDNLHYSQQGYAFLINWNLVLGHGHTQQFFVTFTAIFPSCKLNLEF